MLEVEPLVVGHGPQELLAETGGAYRFGAIGAIRNLAI